MPVRGAHAGGVPGKPPRSRAPQVPNGASRKWPGRSPGSGVPSTRRSRNGVVAHAKDTQPVLSLNDLPHIRSQMTVRQTPRNTHHAWRCNQLRQFVSSTAQRVGVPVGCVDPWHTSRTCRRCGCVDKCHRRAQAEFLYLRCGHHAHADLNAAKYWATRGGGSHPHVCAPLKGPVAFEWQCKATAL